MVVSESAIIKLKDQRRNDRYKSNPVYLGIHIGTVAKKNIIDIHFTEIFKS